MYSTKQKYIVYLAMAACGCLQFPKYLNKGAFNSDNLLHPPAILRINMVSLRHRYSFHVDSEPELFLGIDV